MPEVEQREEVLEGTAFYLRHCGCELVRRPGTDKEQ